MSGKIYKLKDASLVSSRTDDVIVRPCGNCGKALRIYSYWHKSKGYKTAYCDKKCEAAARSMGENVELKGGYIHTESGYHYVRVNGKPVLYHRAVMEKALGRKLLSSEHVHHINGVRHDNSFANLVVVDNKAHPTQKLKLILTLQKRIRELEEQLARAKA